MDSGSKNALNLVSAVPLSLSTKSACDRMLSPPVAHLHPPRVLHPVLLPGVRLKEQWQKSTGLVPGAATTRGNTASEPPAQAARKIGVQCVVGAMGIPFRTYI